MTASLVRKRKAVHFIKKLVKDFLTLMWWKLFFVKLRRRSPSNTPNVNVLLIPPQHQNGISHDVMIKKGDR